MKAFDVVDAFEARVAEYAGARHGVAVDCCTHAIFLCLQYLKAEVEWVTVPARTYVSVPMAVLQAGCRMRFEDFAWQGVYTLRPTPVIDGAKRFRRGMYRGGLHCLSFHAKKILPIGRGGMVLTDDAEVAAWLRRARYDGREMGMPYAQERVDSMGWHMYMTPEQAARGLQLLDLLPEDTPDQREDYPDLRQMPVFR